MLPVLKNLLYTLLSAWDEKRISTELYTSDSDSSTLTWSESSRVQQRYTCAMIGRSWVTRKVVCVHVVAVFQIVHELWVVSHESFTCFTTSAFTLYTYYIELSTGGRTFFFFLRFKCPYHLSCPRLSTSATLTRLGKRQFRIFGQLEYNYNTIFVYTIQYNTIQYLDNLECSNRMLVPELDLIIARSWNRQNDVTVTLNIARKKWKF